MSQSLTTEITISVPLAQLWAAFKDLERLMTRMMPGFIESSKYVEGDGGVGSIREFKFGKGAPLSWSRELLEVKDENKHVYTYRILEGDLLETFSLYRVTWGFNPRNLVDGGGTDVKWTIEYIAAADVISTVEKLSESGIGLMKMLETYLVDTGEYEFPT